MTTYFRAYVTVGRLALTPASNPFPPSTGRVVIVIIVCPLERRDNDKGLSERTVLFMTLVMPSGDTGGHVRRGRRRVPLHRGRVRDVLQVRREAGEARLPQRAVDGQPAVHRGPVEDDGPQEAGRVRGAAPRRVRSRHHHVQRPQLVELRQLGDLLFHRGHDHRYAETPLVRARTGFILRVLQSESFWRAYVNYPRS